MIHSDRIRQPSQGFKCALENSYEESLLVGSAKGKFFIEMRDARTGELQEYRETENIITYDASILCAMMYQAGRTGTAGLIMLAVGTGATGALLNPDAPDPRQRRLNNEIARKAFSSRVFRDGTGAASAIPTNVVDFTTVFGQSEAVGPLNEMGLMRTISDNPAVQNLNPDTFPTRNLTRDLTLYDILVNYLTFAVLSKPNTSILTITWRLTF